MNILESLLQLTEQPTNLPHLGEVYGVWFYYVLCTSAVSMCELTENHANDPELKKLIADLAHGTEKPQLKKLAEFLTREGVPFPQEFPRHPKADPDSIPPGARMLDIEIANIQAMKLHQLLTACTAAMQNTIREDIGVMFVSFEGQIITASFQLKKLMQKRGWLIMPPLYTPASVSH